MQWNYYPNYLHNIKWGFEYTHHDFMPNSVYARSGDTEFDTGKEVHLTSHEAAVYILDEYDINEDLRVNAGVRYSGFFHVGPFDRYVHEPDINVGIPGATTVISYEKNDLVKSDFGFEPRLSVRYTLDKHSSIMGLFLPLAFLRWVAYWLRVY